MARCFPIAHLTRAVESRLALASASTMVEPETSSVKSSVKDVMSRSGIGQSDTKRLKITGQIMDSCGTLSAPGRQEENMWCW